MLLITLRAEGEVVEFSEKTYIVYYRCNVLT